MVAQRAPSPTPTARTTLTTSTRASPTPTSGVLADGGTGTDHADAPSMKYTPVAGDVVKRVKVSFTDDRDNGEDLLTSGPYPTPRSIIAAAQATGGSPAAFTVTLSQISNSDVTVN